MLVRTHPWCPMAPPRLAAVKQAKEFDFVSGYSRYKEAVCDYGLIYGREIKEVLMDLL